MFLHYLNLNLVTVCIYFCIVITEFEMSLLTIINNNYVISKSSILLSTKKLLMQNYKLIYYVSS